MICKNGNIAPLPTFSVVSKYRVPTTESDFGRLTQLLFKKSLYHQGLFAVKRRAVFILGAKWMALVRGWRRDCVVGGMETRFQWRKAHSRTAKCEAFHIAPRLFFMFLFLIPFTIRQHCIIYPQEFSTEPGHAFGMFPMCQRIGNMSKAYPYAMALSFREI